MSVLVKNIAAAAVLFASAITANAASVTLESVTGVWAQAVDGDKVKGIGTSQLSWGRAATRGESGYSFAGVDTPAAIEPVGLFEIGTFTHHNRPIYGNAISSAKLDLKLNLDIGGNKRMIETSFDFSHLETLNSSALCENGGANGSGVNGNGCADRVRASGPGLTKEFVIDGVSYAFTIDGFEDMGELWSAEEKDNSYSLFGFFTEIGIPGPNLEPPAPVPVPAAVWLLGAGLLGLGGLARRRS